MPIIDIQRRLREVGRIRLGEQVANKSGNGTHPAKIDKFRFTSPDERSINAIAGIYGGIPQPWEGAAVGEQWELYADSKELDVLVPPIELAWSQWMENWSGAVCRNRCDGQTDIKNDTACSCDPDSPTCKPTSRLGVILTAVDGIGIWRLESHGWNAASELNGSIEVLRVVQNRGAMVPARLLLEQRQQKKVGKDGKPETFNFAVPVLDLNLSVAALTGGATRQLESGVTPIAAVSEIAPSIADQVRAAENPVEKPRRSNAAAVLPSTGIAPRPASAVESETTPGGASTKSLRRLFAVMNGNKSIPKDDDERHAWAAKAVGHEVESFNDLTQSEINRLNNVADGSEPLSKEAEALNTSTSYVGDDGQVHEYTEDEEPF